MTNVRDQIESVISYCAEGSVELAASDLGAEIGLGHLPNTDDYISGWAESFSYHSGMPVEFEVIRITQYVYFYGSIRRAFAS